MQVFEEADEAWPGPGPENSGKVLYFTSGNLTPAVVQPVLRITACITRNLTRGPQLQMLPSTGRRACMAHREQVLAELQL